MSTGLPDHNIGGDPLGACSGCSTPIYLVEERGRDMRYCFDCVAGGYEDA